MQRGEVQSAAKYLKVILSAHEWLSDIGWRIALSLLACTNTEQSSGRTIGFLQQLDLNGSAPFKATHTTALLVTEYLAANRLNDAIELLEQRVNLHPYKTQPQLHTLLGMLYVFIGVSTLFNNSDQGQVELKALDRTTKSKARLCFETALQATESWVRGETGRRQRVWGMHVKESEADGARVWGRRGRVWGRDVMEGEEWVGEEHEDVKRVRRRLEGGADGSEGGSGDGEDSASSASGSVYSDSGSESFGSDEEEARGRSRTLHLNPPQQDEADSPAESPDPHPTAPATKGPKAWSAAWPSVAPFYTPQPPLAYHIAQQFLELLTGSTTSSTTFTATGAAGAADARNIQTSHKAEEDDADSDSVGGDLVDEIQLTREEAELRLRRILFEDQGEGSEPSAVRTKKERSRDGRDRKKRKRHDSSGQSRSKRRDRH